VRTSLENRHVVAELHDGNDAFNLVVNPNIYSAVPGDTIGSVLKRLALVMSLPAPPTAQWAKETAPARGHTLRPFLSDCVPRATWHLRIQSQKTSRVQLPVWAMGQQCPVLNLRVAFQGTKKKAARALRRTAFSCNCRPGTAPVPPHLCLILMQLG
jgi:hypothetical protein